MTDNARADSPLFRLERVIVEPMDRPVVVVGLPRSGSSWLSDILSQTDDYFVFDDLYLYRRAMGLGATGVLDEAQLADLIHFLGWQVRARIRHGVFERTRTSLREEDVDAMDRALEETFRGTTVRWHELMVEWIGRLALHQGRTRWGFKAPQDFLHIDTYRSLFPGVRFVFLYRDPRRVLRSLKFVRDEDGDPRQYHPVVYARYWRLASQMLSQVESADADLVHTLRFEVLARDPQGAAEEIARFLGTRVPQLHATDSNTSFEAGRAVRELTPTEVWLCERIAGEEMVSRGYGLGSGRFRIRDLPDLLATTSRFVAYQLGRMWRDPSARYAVGQFLRSPRLMRGRSGIG